MSSSFNTPITFGRGGSAAALDCTGIDFVDAGDRSWTTAPVAEMEIRLPPAREDVTLEMDVGVFSNDEKSTQQVFVFLGGSFIGFWRVRSFGRLTAKVPRGLLAGRPARLAFVLPDATSPMNLGLSEDRRELGLHLQAINFKLG